MQAMDSDDDLPSSLRSKQHHTPLRKRREGGRLHGRISQNLRRRRGAASPPAAGDEGSQGDSNQQRHRRDGIDGQSELRPSSASNRRLPTGMFDRAVDRPCL